MTVQEYFDQVKTLDVLVEKKVNRAEMLKKSLYGRGLSSNYDTIGKSNCSSKDALGHAIATYMDASNEADTLIDKLCDLRVEVGKLIDLIPNENQRLVLEHHYLMYLSDIQIAEKLGYCRQHVHKLLQSGLEAVEKEVTECDIILLDVLKSV